MVAHPKHDLIPVERAGQEVIRTELKGSASESTPLFLGQLITWQEANAVSAATEQPQYLQAVGPADV